MSWLAFCRARNLFTYLGHAPRLYLDGGRPGIVGRGRLASGSFGLAYAPWLLVAALLVLGRPSRARLGLALGTAALTGAADALIYLTSPGDPTLWVGAGSSGPRSSADR